jgi:probable phosphoglycerate mutase
VPLSPEGRQQAGSVASALASRPLIAVACSPLRRAAETAGIVAASHRLDPVIDRDFAEVDLGAWEGLTRAEAAERWPDQHRAWRRDPAAVRPPGGETLAEAAARAVPAFRALVARHAGATLALVGHSLIIRVLLCQALCAGLDAVGHMRCQPGSIAVVDMRGGEATVRQLNETCHLRGEPG